MRSLYSNVSSNPNGPKREWRHFQKLQFLQDECGLEIDGQMENDYTFSIVSEDDASSTLYHLPNNQQTNETVTVINSSTTAIENGQSSNTSTLATQSNETSTNNTTNNLTNHTVRQPNVIVKRRKTNLSSSIKNSPSFVTSNRNTLNQISEFNNLLPKFNPLSEEEIFGHSIAASLRKFDDKKKEIVKLKLQEVIVQVNFEID